MRRIVKRNGTKIVCSSRAGFLCESAGQNLRCMGYQNTSENFAMRCRVKVQAGDVSCLQNLFSSRLRDYFLKGPFHHLIHKQSIGQHHGHIEKQPQPYMLPVPQVPDAVQIIHHIIIQISRVSSRWKTGQRLPEYLRYGVSAEQNHTASQQQADTAPV